MSVFRLRITIGLALALVSTLLLSPTSSALAGFDYSSTMRWAGGASTSGFPDQGVDVAGGIAVVAGGWNDLTVFDVSDPDNPVDLALMETGIDHNRVLIDGNRFFVAGGLYFEGIDSGTLLIYDISDPKNPVPTDWIEFWDFAYDLALAGDHLYVVGGASGAGSLRVFDVSADPVVEEGWVGLPDVASGVCVTDGYAYVSAGDAGVITVDLSDPQNPSIADVFDTIGSASDIDLDGSHLYVADGVEGLLVCSLVVPEAPVQVGALDTSGTADEVGVLDGTVFVGSSNGFVDGDLVAVDVSTPSSPTELGTVGLNGAIQQMAGVGTRVYLASGNSSLQIYDVSSTASPEVVSGPPSSDTDLDVVVSGTVAYLAEGASGIRVLDVTNPASPVDAGVFDLGHDVLTFALQGSYLYVGGGWPYEVEVVDLSVPLAPVSVGVYDFGGFTTIDHIAVDGSRLLVVDSHNLRLADISDPTQPIETAVVPLGPDAYSMVIDGIHAYVSSNDHVGGTFFHTLDLSDMSNPSVVATLELPWSYGIEKEGNFVYVPAHFGGINVIDVSTPASPFVVGSADGFVVTGPPALANGILYVPSRPSGVWVYDVANPANPVALGSANTKGTAYSAAVIGDRLLVADRTLQYSILPLHAVTTDVDVQAQLLGQPMLAAYPNPSRGAVRLELRNGDGNPEGGRLEIFDVLGQRVCRIDAISKAAGDGFVASWDGLDDARKPVGTGVYFARFDKGCAVIARITILR